MKNDLKTEDQLYLMTLFSHSVQIKITHEHPKVFKISCESYFFLGYTVKYTFTYKKSLKNF